MNKTIFKQTFKENIRILLLITVVLSVIFVIMTKVFNPASMSGMSGALSGTPLAGLFGDTSMLGMLSQSFYSIQAIILPLIFIIVVGGNLIVSQVDKGSMAYTLSTPVKRRTVATTQAIFFVGSIFFMTTVLTIVGALGIQVFYGTVWGEYITPDAKVISEKYEVDSLELEHNLQQILDNEDYLEIGAEEREITVDQYKSYITQKQSYNAYLSGAESLGVDISDVQADPNLILDNENAIGAAAEVYDITPDEYITNETVKIQQKELLADQLETTQENFMNGLNVAAKELDVEVTDITSDYSILTDNRTVYDKALEESTLNEETFNAIIDNQIGASELSVDNGIVFKVKDYLLINVGLFLLMFAISSISYFCSCYFNITNKYMAFGAGIPLAFYLLDMMRSFSDSLEPIKYITINTLFDTEAILNGEGYLIEFVALALIGIICYTLAVNVFVKKDLPL